jgi:hypothetical protein
MEIHLLWIQSGIVNLQKKNHHLLGAKFQVHLESGAIHHLSVAFLQSILDVVQLLTRPAVLLQSILMNLELETHLAYSEGQAFGLLKEWQEMVMGGQWSFWKVLNCEGK